MNLLDKYVIQVGKHLPRRNRLDLQTEIRSTIEDMLEDCSQQTGRPVDDELIGEVLMEYGSPEKVAAAYQPTRYLIGPRLYPFFIMVVKIVIAVLFGVGLIGFTIKYISSGGQPAVFGSELGKFFTNLISGMMSALGNIVLVFAIIERVKPETAFDEEAEKWKPSDLEAEVDPDQIGRTETIVEIIFTALGLAILNFYPNIIGLGVFSDETWYFFPALSDAFFRYLPWINLLGGLQILLDLYLLREGLWRTATRLIGLAVQLAGIALAWVMLTGPSLVNLDAEKMGLAFGEPAGWLHAFFSSIPQVVLAIVIIVESIEFVQTVWRMVARRKNLKSFLPGG